MLKILVLTGGNAQFVHDGCAAALLLYSAGSLGKLQFS